MKTRGRAPAHSPARTLLTSAPGRSPLTIVVFGTFDERQHPRARVMIESLEDLGHHVVRCNEPFDVSTEERIRVARKPWRAAPLVFRLASCWWRLARAARRVGRHAPDVVLVGYLGVLDVHVARLCFAGPIVLDNMAPLGGIAKDRSLPFAKVFSLADRLAAKAVDVVVWDTEEHMSTGSMNGNDIVVHVGAPADWFDQPGRSPDRTAPMSVCFFGLYTPLQGTTTIAEAVRLLRDRSDVTWTLIGHGQDRAKAEEIVGTVDTVRWIDWLDAAQLPGVVAEHDVCLGIFGSTPKALRVVPNKVYQGAAAGCAVITSDTAPQRSALGEAGRYVPVADAVALAKTIEELADDRALLASMQAAARARAVERFSPHGLGIEMQRVVDAATAHRHCRGDRPVQSAGP